MVIDLTKVTLPERATMTEDSVLPEGKYNAFVDTAEFRETKDGTGEYIKVMWKVTDSTAKNRTVFQNFNTKNKNTKATEIGLQQLKTLFTVNNKGNAVIHSAKDLLGLKAKLTVKIETHAEYGDQNVVKGLSTYEGPVGTTTTTASYQGRSSGSPVPGL